MDAEKPVAPMRTLPSPLNLVITHIFPSQRDGESFSQGCPARREATLGYRRPNVATLKRLHLNGGSQVCLLEPAVWDYVMEPFQGSLQAWHIPRVLVPRTLGFSYGIPLGFFRLEPSKCG